MVQGVYIASAGPGAGKSLVVLGVVDALHRHSGNLGLFRPVVNGPDPRSDPVLAMMRRLYDLGAARCRADTSLTGAQAMTAAGHRDDLVSQALTDFGELAAEADVVVVDGSDLTGIDPAFEFGLNAALARNLGLPVLAVIGGKDRTPAIAADAVAAALRQFRAAHCQLLGVVVNRVTAASRTQVQAAVSRAAGETPCYVIPEVPEISTPSVADVVSSLQLPVHSGSEELDRDVLRVIPGAMTVDNFLRGLRTGDLVIVPGDRTDIIMASLASALSAELPTAAAMMLTDGLLPVPDVAEFLAISPFPVLETRRDLLAATRLASGVRSEIHTGEKRKTAAALGVWARSVSETDLLERLALPHPGTMTPLRFFNELIARARKHKRHIVLAEGEELRVLRAAEILRRRGVCDVTVLGGVAAVRELAGTHGVNVDGLRILDPEEAPQRERFAAEYCRLRAHKGMIMERAREIMLDGSYFGTMMVNLGEADGMVSGAAHPTANTIRPALEFVKGTRPGALVSSVFFMLLPERVLVYGDCAVVPDPTAEQLAAIALASADTAARFGVEPRVAMLSYATGESGGGAPVEKVRKATELVRAARPLLPIAGPIQYDAAVDSGIARSKLPFSPVAGNATVFIFPDLNTGNNTYKAVEQSAGAVAVGPILQGLRKPINDLSRGSTVEDIVNTVAITAIQAQGPG